MKKFFLVIVIVFVVNNLSEIGFVCAQFGADSSFDSLVASQCRARCISLYPWRLHSQPAALRYFQKRNSVSISDVKVSSRNIRARTSRRNKNQRGHFRWNRIMEMCSKDNNCLQCTLPCDIPTNLLSNCKYLCKDRNQLCLDSCDLLTRLNQEKYGSCPSFVNEPSNTIQLLISAKGQLSESTTILNQCSNDSKSSAIASLLRNNEEHASSVTQCGQDSDCGDIKKCCPLHTACPKYGNVCAKPVIQNKDISSTPYNLTIVERKRGKTIILKWNCDYDQKRPTLFVVEGRWSLKSPQASTTIDQDGHVISTDSDDQMTKWGYLAQTINNNWIILRNINRGRWYKFRVSSITKSGTMGYSKPTPLFILSSAPKPPSQPQNLTVQRVYSESSSIINADLTWLPSRRSDLPIIHYKLTWRQENSNNPHYGYDLIEDSVNKYTIKDLLKDTSYSIELIAVSKYENQELKSKSQRTEIDTSQILSVAQSSYLISDYAEEEDLENEDLNHEEYETRNLRNHHLTPVENRIRNLTVKNPYFRNGLVKAKLSWYLSEKNEQYNDVNSINSASINSIVIEQPIFTITWFPIKCANDKDESKPSHRLPTPITATTINTNFEIYELKYNCDYVVNIRLDNKHSSGVSSSLNPTPPQVASAQFQVPSCDSVEIIGHIRPRCYLSRQNSLPRIHRPTISSILPEFTTTSTILTTTEQLPRVYNIRHRIVKRQSNFYSVRFTWSLPEFFTSFSGYQISVVPKAIPGFSTQLGVSSVGAIVEKDKNSFVVKQLSSSVKYIFQIQLIALDNQSYGPASNIEFKIKPFESRRTTSKQVYSIDRENNKRRLDDINLRATTISSFTSSASNCLDSIYSTAAILVSLVFLNNNVFR